MKILHVIGSMDPVSGGPCQGIRNSIQALGQSICLREVVSLDEPTASFLGTDDFPIHALGRGKGPWQYNENLIPWLEENLERFDVVIINGLWLYTSYATVKVLSRIEKRQVQKGKAAKIPKLFVMPHGMLDPYFQRAPERRLKAVRNWAYWKLVENKIVNKANGVLFTCETELQLAQQPFRPYKPKKEINVGYGIVAPPPFTDEMREAFYKICPDVAGKPFLLFLSRIHQKKGVDLLLKAYTQLLRENVDLPRLVVAGPGFDTDYGKRLLSLVKRDSFLSSNVVLPGMLSGDAKWGAFYSCEAFVLPSHQENFGIAVVEALACEKPVLISNQVNIWKEINAEGGGLVVDDTMEGTMQLLRTWVEMNRVQKRAMQQHAYGTYQKYFEISQVAHKFLEAISS